MAHPPRPVKEPKQPGLWLEAFMDGYKGTGTSAGGSGPATGPTGHTSEETAGKGEQ